MIMRMALIAACLAFVGCDDIESLDNFDVPIEAEVVVERGTAIEMLLVGFPPLEGFTRIDLSESSAFGDNGYRARDVDSLILKSLVMTVVAPDAEEADLSFFGEVAFIVEAEGLEPIEIARATEFPPGAREVVFTTVDDDLKHYLVGTAGSITADIRDTRRPDVDTTVRIEAIFDVDVNVL